MSATLVGVVQVLALLSLIAAFTYGFAVKVSWRSVIAAAAASVVYLASFGPTVLARYRFEEWGVLVGLAVAGALVLALLAWLFVRWPASVAPTLALLAAVRLPIPVARGADLGAAPEYLFLLVPLYLATVAALVAEAVRPDADPRALARRDPLRRSRVVSFARAEGLLRQGRFASAEPVLAELMRTLCELDGRSTTLGEHVSELMGWRKRR